jgi:hypothetical protein
MNLIELGKYKSKIDFSIDDLLILKNSLTEVNLQFSANDFLSLIYDMTKDESSEYITAIEEVISHYNKGLKSPLNNKISDLIQPTKEGVLIELSYEKLFGFRSVLNVIYSGACVVFKNFNLQIGFDKSEVKSLLTNWFNVVEEMGKNTIENILYEKATGVLNDLGIKYYGLPDEILLPQIRKECQLNLQSHVVLFLLFSQNRTRRVFSGIKIIIGQSLEPITFFAKSHVGITRHNDLIKLVAYLELAIVPTTDDNDLKRFILSLSYPHSSLLSIQLISRSIELKEIKSIKIRIRLYSPIQEDSPDSEYLEIEDTLSTSNIHSFVASVKDFLCEQSIAQKN